MPQSQKFGCSGTCTLTVPWLAARACEVSSTLMPFLA